MDLWIGSFMFKSYFDSKVSQNTFRNKQSENQNEDINTNWWHTTSNVFDHDGIQKCCFS